MASEQPTHGNDNQPDDIDVILGPGDTEESLRGRFRFIDVREDAELALEPIADALHMPTSAFDSAMLDSPKDAPLLIICARGRRSRAAAEYLRQQGWVHAYSLYGGLPALRQLG